MKTQRDYGMAAIVTLVVGVAIWLLLMPWIPAIGRTTLNRFHLNSGSFATWAVQFPIPAMYNFANRYEVRRKPMTERDDADWDDADRSRQRLVNHFPVRIFTFADGRYVHLRYGEDRWLTVESSYRGQTLRSSFHAQPNPAGKGFDLRRLESEFTEP